MNYAEWRDRLATANDPAFHPVEYQDWLVTEGPGQFWATETGALITKLNSYPGGAITCETYAAAGDMASLLSELKPAIEAWAKSCGCSHCLITAGRPGWRKVHPDYAHYQTTIYKELS